MIKRPSKRPGLMNVQTVYSFHFFLSRLNLTRTCVYVSFVDPGNEFVGRQIRIVIELVLYVRERFIRLTGDRPTVFFHPYRKVFINIKPRYNQSFEYSLAGTKLSTKLCNSSSVIGPLTAKTGNVPSGVSMA